MYVLNLIDEAWKLKKNMANAMAIAWIIGK